MSAETSSPAGVIHDLGYRSYDGIRYGRSRIVAALAWHSFRAAFGIGRSAKAKIVPIITLVVMLLPAIVNAFAMSQGNPRQVDYDTYVPALRGIIMIIFVAVQVPELVSRDIRSRVLPLYFSRPIKVTDYPLAKYLGFSGALLAMIDVPLLALYAGAVANVHGGSAVWAQTRALIPGLLVGLMWALSIAAISLFLASLTGRRAFATGAVAVFFLGTYVLAEILLQVETQNADNAGPRFGGPGSVPATMAEKVAGLFSPYTLFDGVRMWLGATDRANGVPKVGAFGAVYAIVLIIVVAASLYGLAARYRKARLS
jgi:ABC-2 type transport system permease protein